MITEEQLQEWEKFADELPPGESKGAIFELIAEIRRLRENADQIQANFDSGYWTGELETERLRRIEFTSLRFLMSVASNTGGTFEAQEELEALLAPAEETHDE